MKNLCGPLFLAMIGLCSGCSSGPEAVPDSMKSQVDPSITFQQILDNPEQFQGKTVVLGGEVLSAKRLSDSTQLEVLQLPLDDSQRPSIQKTDSRGRFLAFTKTFLDPATMPPKTRITIVGEVIGPQTGNLDEMTYQYPAFSIRHFHVWQEKIEDIQRNSGPWYGIFGGGSTGGGGFGGGGGIGIGF